jgi:hypothetical protein
VSEPNHPKAGRLKNARQIIIESTYLYFLGYFDMM